MPDQSLYERLDGAGGIAKLVDDIVEAHLSNPAIKARFLPYLERPDVVAQVKQHMCDLLGAGSGGPEQYDGRDMRTTHTGMNISEREFVAAIDDILGVLEGHGAGQQEKDEVLAMLYSMKDEVVHV